MSKRLVFVCLVALFPLSLHAAIGCGSPGSGPCQNDASQYDVVSYCNSVDQCFAYGATSGTTICSDSWGCPFCDANLTKSLCTRHRYSSGWCSCTDPLPMSPGDSMPHCTLKGSCRYAY
jgi:hypothetical protein